VDARRSEVVDGAPEPAYAAENGSSIMSDTASSSAVADHRRAAHQHVEELLALLRTHAGAGDTEALIEECEALARAISAFHMEGIRFRMYNVDRQLARTGTLPPQAAPIFQEIRTELEAAGFHTRSH
jgi:hypothetical protein